MVKAIWHLENKTIKTANLCVEQGLLVVDFRFTDGTSYELAINSKWQADGIFHKSDKDADRKSMQLL